MVGPAQMVILIVAVEDDEEKTFPVGLLQRKSIESK